jgi:hypothetical protein
MAVETHVTVALGDRKPSHANATKDSRKSFLDRHGVPESP